MGLMRAVIRRSWAAIHLAAIFVFAALAIGMSSPALAQDPSEAFVSLWTEYLSICGPALAAPDQVLANRQLREGYDAHLFHSTADQTAISLEHHDEDFLNYAEVSLIRSDTLYALYCDISQYNDEEIYAGQIPAVGETIRTIVAQSPGLEITGGPFDLLPDSVLDRTYGFEGPEYGATFVITGAFPDFPLALTQLYIDDYGMYLVLVTSWRAEP